MTRLHRPARRASPGVLGPFEVLASGEALSLGGARPRALLALLLVNAGQSVAIDRVIDEL